ncbi:MAG: UDP-N-acetylmuramoyl-tripeptide--D-alanyl-D-alanine ligase [Epsilonproteobacteria bacterium]|nr:UDP-N-acetylmuramoyl-tripeptide--D-alanyl-D-alanine ligase [Campylobacterota bacterium]
MQLDHAFLKESLPYASISVEGQQQWQAREVTVSIDSRHVKPEQFFVALKGARVDGNNFVADALARGACGVLVDDDGMRKLEAAPAKDRVGKVIVHVPDSMQAFVDLARAWRAQLRCPVVGVTGSVGKTTTKEMIRTILRTADFPAFVSYKNYNTLIGTCYNLLNVPGNVKAAVLELGISQVGEMHELVDVARPTIGLITTVSHAHLQGLGGSVTCVAAQKRALFDFFGGSDIGIINGDVPLLTDFSYPHPIAKFGFKTKNHIQARKVRIERDKDGNLVTHFALKCYGKKVDVTINGNHPGFVVNALGAVAISYFLKIPFDLIVRGLQAYQGFEGRFQFKQLRNGKGNLLNDCYNANPESMRAALEAFSQIKVAGSKIAVLGDMLELGEKELYWHRQIGRVLAKLAPLDGLILVGERARHIASPLLQAVNVVTVDSWQQAQQELERMIVKDDSLVLTKASRGVNLSLLVEKVSL